MLEALALEDVRPEVRSEYAFVAPVVNPLSKNATELVEEWKRARLAELRALEGQWVFAEWEEQAGVVYGRFVRAGILRNEN